jgi:rubrerythrin
MNDDLISRQAATDALWKALYEYEDKTEEQFQESDELDVGDWMQHRIFVQNMSDIDRQTILALPSAERKKGRWIKRDKNLFPFGTCSECGYISVEADRANFCPNCGARMEEE